MNRKRITLLGATGSIGASALDVISRHPDRYEVFALTAHNRTAELFDLCCQHRPKYAVTGSQDAAVGLQKQLKESGLATEVLYGAKGLSAVASMAEVDCVLAAIVGAAGLTPTLAAVKGGKQILLANKEALVMAGQIFMDEVSRSNAVLLPIDSEHNAIFQSLTGNAKNNPLGCGVRRILLTASGGPFKGWTTEALQSVTPAQACAHPKWSMGKKISVDSATLMNKGLEVIEAHWMFGLPPEKIEVMIHPQSVIHSMVEYIDGSTMAQLGNPDMRTPIAHALAYPERIDAGVKPLDLFDVAQLTFERPDRRCFPCLDLAYAALRSGGTTSTILNAANEVAVEAFLNLKIPFMRIPEIIETTLEKVTSAAADSVASVLDADYRARQTAASLLEVQHR